MSEIKILQLHKRESPEFSKIQDKYALDEEAGCFALADGTTQSFNSERWAEIITKKFIRTPTFAAGQLIKLFNDCVETYKTIKFKFDPNSAIASLQKTKYKLGGTSTFIGLKLIDNNEVQLISCGDSNFFQIRKDILVQSFPYSEVDLLDKNRYFINTENLLENKVDESYFKTAKISYVKDDLLILATDALSRLFLQKPKIIREFLSIEDFKGLHNFCLTYWNKKELEEDDISVIIINPVKSNHIKIIKPPKDFSFPTKKQKEFIPTSLIQEKETPLIKSTDMQEIRTNFRQFGQDLRNLKDQLSLQKLLLLIILGMMVITIFFIFFSRSSKNENNLQRELLEKTIEIENLTTRLDSLTKENSTLKADLRSLQSNIIQSEGSEGTKRLVDSTQSEKIERDSRRDSIKSK